MKTEDNTHRLEDCNFDKLAKTESNPRAITRLYVLHQYSFNKKVLEIAENLGISNKTVSVTKERFLKDGLSGIYDKQRSGRNSKLASKHIDRLKKRIIQEQEQEEREGGRIIGEDIQKILSKEYNADYSLNGVDELMKRIDISWISARSQHH